jgi:hypothetical protein
MVRPQCGQVGLFSFFKTVPFPLNESALIIPVLNRDCNLQKMFIHPSGGGYSGSDGSAGPAVPDVHDL